LEDEKVAAKNLFLFLITNSFHHFAFTGFKRLGGILWGYHNSPQMRLFYGVT